MGVNIYIPLGNSCSIAYNLRLLDLRNLAFPFDWVRVTNFNNITTLLENEFEDFLNLDTFEFKEISDKFEVNGNNKSYIYSNNYCTFYHDFDDYIENINIDTFLEKYNRRIKRFLDCIKSKNHLTFIREEYGKVKLCKINKFIKAIQEINPTLNFKLVIITNNKNLEDIDNVIFYYSDKSIIDWRRPEIDWTSVFNL